MNNTKPTIFLTVGSFLIFLLLIYFLILPKYQEFQKKQSEIKLREQFLANSVEYFKNVSQLSEKLNQSNWKEVREKIDINFSSNSYFLPSLYSFFQNKVLEHGLYLKKITASASSPLKKEAPSSQETETAKTQKKSPYVNLKGPVYETTFNLSVFGSYASFKNFLSDIEKQAHLMNVGQITFSSPTASLKKEEAPVGSSPFDLTIGVYSY